MKNINFSVYEKLIANKKVKQKIALALILIIASFTCYYLVSINEGQYDKTIAKVISIIKTKDTVEYSLKGVPEQTYMQNINATVMNGPHKGQKIKLQNKISYTKAYDLDLKKNDEVFVSIKDDGAKKILSVSIRDYKRDKYISYIVILFTALIILIGGYKGLKSLVSVIVNVIIFFGAMILYFHGWNLIFVSILASVLFAVMSILLVSGINKKTAAAIIGTISGTALSMLITLLIVLIADFKGLHFEEMEYLTTSDYYQIFIAEIIIGTLGGIMDIAISISSAIKELYEENPGIEKAKLTQSAMEIGRDIMGTMANTLVFAYISGSIPMILLWFKNGYSIFYVIQYGINLEIARALTGSIGIVISIPVTLYISIMFIKRTAIGEKAI